MHILVLGGGGMVGRKFIQRLAAQGALGGREIVQVTAHDVVMPERPTAAGFRFQALSGDFSLPGVATSLIESRPDLIVHLAAIVSGEAEADFEKGYRINLDGTRLLLDAIRLAGDGYRPRLVFTSSIAVFGAPFPDAIADEYFTTPLTSYGAQKAMGELLLADYTRRGFVDGIGIRLPTICVRPGTPNKAASGFFSNIMREPMSGKEAVLPVGEDVRHWFASPRAAVDFLVHAATMDTAALGARVNLTMPGLSATVGEQIDSLRRIAGERAVQLIRREPDAIIRKIVAGWPRNFNAERAQKFGFKAERNFDEILRAHLEDELGGKLGV
jgi:D-erythronate 2-dehydrogenase